jgi:cytoskeleton protein RodZ
VEEMAREQLMSHVLLPGQRLCEARDAKGLSVADVAQALHMSTAYVKALEADDYERLPEAAFVKGYLRNYARLVGLPADDIANMFSQVMAEEAPSNAPERSDDLSASEKQQSWLLYAGVGVVALVAVLWIAFSPEAGDVSKPSVGVSDEREVAVEGLSADGGDGVDDAEPTLSQVEPQLGDALASDVAADSRAEAGAAVEEELKPLVDVVAATADILKVTFTDDCWVKVSDASGATVFTGQKSAASKLVVQGQSPFRITLGNAAAVSSISVNDSSVSVPTAKPGRVLTLRAE